MKVKPKVGADFALMASDRDLIVMVTNSKAQKWFQSRFDDLIDWVKGSKIILDSKHIYAVQDSIIAGGFSYMRQDLGGKVFTKSQSKP